MIKMNEKYKNLCCIYMNSEEETKPWYEGIFSSNCGYFGWVVLLLCIICTILFIIAIKGCPTSTQEND